MSEWNEEVIATINCDVGGLTETVVTGYHPESGWTGIQRTCKHSYFVLNEEIMRPGCDQAFFAGFNEHGQPVTVGITNAGPCVFSRYGSGTAQFEGLDDVMRSSIQLCDNKPLFVAQRSDEGCDTLIWGDQIVDRAQRIRGVTVLEDGKSFAYAMEDGMGNWMLKDSTGSWVALGDGVPHLNITEIHSVNVQRTETDTFWDYLVSSHNGRSVSNCEFILRYGLCNHPAVGMRMHAWTMLGGNGWTIQTLRSGYFVAKFTGFGANLVSMGQVGHEDTYRLIDSHLLGSVRDAQFATVSYNTTLMLCEQTRGSGSRATRHGFMIVGGSRSGDLGVYVPKTAKIDSKTRDVSAIFHRGNELVRVTRSF